MNPLNTEPQIIIFVSSITLLVVVVYLSLLYFQKIKKQILLSEKKLTEEMRFSIQPKFMEISIGVNDLVDLAIEIWRMEQRLAESSASIPENHSKGLDNSIQRLKRYVQKYDIEIIDYTNQKFNDGLNLDILSVEKDPSLSSPIVKKTIEPTVLCKGQVVRKAKIILLTSN